MVSFIVIGMSHISHKGADRLTVSGPLNDYGMVGEVFADLLLERVALFLFCVHGSL